MAENTAASDAERMRNKRLAKLGNQNPASENGQSSPSGSATSQKEPQPQSAASPKSQAEQSPLQQIGMKQQDPQIKPPNITIRPSAASPQPDQPSRPRSHARVKSSDLPGEWEHRTLSNLFRITLDVSRTTDINGNTFYYADSIVEELEGEGKPKRLTVGSDESSGSLESAITIAASNQGSTRPLEYLLQCWKRITRLSRSLKNGQPDPAKMHVVNEARRLCMSYSIFVVTIPEMFENQQQSTSFMPHLLAEQDVENALDHDWLQEAASRVGDDQELKDKLVEAAEQMSQELATKSMNDDYRPYIQGLSRLLRFQPLVVAIAESPHFHNPNVPAQDLEKNTLLGPFFRLSPMQAEVATNYFAAATTRDRGYIVNSQSALRMTLSQHQTNLFELVDRFIKTKVSRERLLDWFAAVVNANHKRRAIQVDPRFVSSDGFMVNVTVCLDRLCEPFMDASFSKIDRIDINYLRRSPRVQISDETKINADQAASDNFYNQPAEGENNFISELFFLTAAAHHYGTEAAQSKMKDMKRMIKRMDEQLESFEGQRERYANQPQILAVFEQRLTQAKQENERRQSVYHAIEGVLLDEQLQARAMSFMRYVIVWVMRLVSGVDFPKQKFALPLPKEQPEVFKCLPEYFLDDVVDHFKFVTQAMPHVSIIGSSSTQARDSLINFRSSPPHNATSLSRSVSPSWRAQIT